MHLLQPRFWPHHVGGNLLESRVFDFWIKKLISTNILHEKPEKHYRTLNKPIYDFKIAKNRLKITKQPETTKVLKPQSTFSSKMKAKKKKKPPPSNTLR